VSTVVVTGASAGLGRAIANGFAARGDRVGLLARGTERLDAAVKEAEARGGHALALPADVADADAVDAAADRVEDAFGPIDVWVNNAMTSVFAPFWDIEQDEFDRVTHVTYLGYVNGTRAALRRMRARDRGMIVQVGSALAYRGIPLQSAYCGAKHAIQGFTEAVRCELLHEHSGVRITMVQMPAMNTPQFDWCLSRMPRRAQPVPPIFQPEVAATMVVHATEHYRREYWATWSTVKAIAGNRIMPAILDRMLGATGFSSQQTPEPADPHAASNLWEPVAEPWAAHGRFDATSRVRSGAVAAVLRRDAITRRTGLSRLGDKLADVAASALARLA
jgi:short-subunit dehydrogenase